MPKNSWAQNPMKLSFWEFLGTKRRYPRRDLARDCAETSKREVLKSLASVFDPLGVASPTTLVGKMIRREACEHHLQSDAELREKLEQQ